MIKIFKAYFLILIFSMLITTPAKIYAKNNAADAKLFVNNIELNNLPSPPVFYNDYLLVPTREVFEPLGAQLQYNDKDKVLYIFYKDNLICIQADNKKAYINETYIEMTIPAKIINNKLLVPLRSVSEFLELEITWDGTSKTAFVSEKSVDNNITAPNNGNENTSSGNTTNNSSSNSNDTGSQLNKGDSSGSNNNSNGFYDDNYIKDIVVPAKNYEYIIALNEPLEKYEKITNIESKFVLDLYNVGLEKPISKDLTNNKFIKSIRTGFDIENGFARTRIVFDLTTKNNDVAVNLSDDRKYIHVDFDFEAEDLKVTTVTNNNYFYDSANTRFVIAKSNPNIVLNGYKIFDDYKNKKITIVFKNNFGFGNDKFTIKNSNVNYFEFSTVNDHTYLAIYENDVFIPEITEDSSRIYINMKKPVDVTKKVVVIDPGHGGSDPGANKGNRVEKEIVLKISEKLFDKIEKEGKLKAYLTRSDDTYVKKEDRVIFGDKVGDVFVSVHNNSFTTEIPVGIETYYYERNDGSAVTKNSLKLASIVQKNLIQDTKAFDRKVKSNSYIVIKSNRIPAILIETGFISNSEEGAKLLTDEYQEKIADSVYRSLLEYFAA